MVYNCDDCGSCGTRTQAFLVFGDPDERFDGGFLANLDIAGISPGGSGAGSGSGSGSGMSVLGDVRDVVESQHSDADVYPNGPIDPARGPFVLHIEGYSDRRGAYILNMDCHTDSPTAAPTQTPTTSTPTQTPTTSTPTVSPTVAPSQSPTIVAAPVEIDFGGQCSDHTDDERTDLLDQALMEFVNRFNTSIDPGQINATICEGSGDGSVVVTIRLSFAGTVDDTAVAEITSSIENDPIDVTIGGRTLSSRNGLPESTSDSDSDDDGLSNGEIAGIVIAALVLLILLLVAWVSHERSQRQAQKANPSSPTPSEMARKESNANFEPIQRTASQVSAV